MSIEMVLYLIDVFGKVEFFINAVTGITVLLTLGLWVAVICTHSEWKSKELYLGSKYSDEFDERKCKKVKQDYHTLVKCLKGSIFFMIPLFIFCIIMPSQKTMYMMLASNAAKKSEIPEKVLKAIALRLDEYIDEIKDKVKE